MNIFESLIWTNEKNGTTHFECFYKSSGILFGHHHISEDYEVQPSFLFGWIYRWSDFLFDGKLHFIFSRHKINQWKTFWSIWKHCWYTFLCRFALYLAGGLYCEYWCGLMWLILLYVIIEFSVLQVIWMSF